MLLKTEKWFIREESFTYKRMKHNKQLQEKLGIVGQSPKIAELLEMIETAAPTNITILIYGESGTGKEVVANSIHKLSERKHQTFVAINCGALPDNLIDSELFGYEKGAFTGAVAQKKGLFEVADHGTIFLDELGEMPIKTQVRLLRVLESGEMTRVGGTESIKVDVRVIAATHRKLEDLIETGEFRRDLYYRLKAITITLPSLRERKEDINLLIDHFIKHFILSNHIIFGGLDDEAREALNMYHWPGNIRELKNTLESLLVLARGQRITTHHILMQIPNINQYYESEKIRQNSFPVHINKSSDEVERGLIYQNILALRMEIAEIKSILNQLVHPNQNYKSLPISSSAPSELIVYNDTRPIVAQPSNNNAANYSMDEMEKDMIIKALERFQGNRRKASQALNISERTLYRKIKEYNLEELE
jgi:transcriptional regulator with PAS, ATPase and Fis domain